MVKIHHSYESFEGLRTGWPGEFRDVFDFAWEGPDPVLVDSVAEKIDLGYPKLAFLQFDYQPVILETVEKDT